MKTEGNFLKELRKNLHFLSKDEKKEVISEYKTKIEERSKKGENIKSIIGSFERPETIAERIHTKEVYSKDRYNVNNVDILEKDSKIDLLVIPKSVLFFFSFVWIIVAIAAVVGSIFAFIFIWLNFDPLVAVGPSLLIFGLLALIALFLWWIGKKTLLMNSSLLWTFKKLPKKKEFQNQKKIKKIFIIVLVSILSLFTISGIIGTFATTKTLGRALINSVIDNKNKNDIIKKNGKFDQYEYSFLHQQTSEVVSFASDEIQSLDLTKLYSLTIYGLVVEINPNNENSDISVEIIRDYNTKENTIGFNWNSGDNGNIIVGTDSTQFADKILKMNRFTIKVNINSNIVNIDESIASNLKFSIK